jgi:peptidoglycan/xylan/chitin deacetylase (PgdA/CDA1 family)
MVPQRKLCLSAILACGLVGGLGLGAARAGDVACPGNPNALGVSRVITVTPNDYSRLGSMQYRQTLPLADHEVVLTFDDGPLPPYTSRVLTALAHECVKATFFMVGSMARAYPQMVRLVAELGHTIGNHSQNHPIHFDAIGEARAENEVENGIRSIKTALAGEGALAPYFRVPGLGRTHAVEKFLQSQNIVVWSSDTVADDWTPISSDQVLHRALRRLEARGRGILLLHDIHNRTASMLPALLRALKARGFHIVHVVPGKAPQHPQPEVANVMVASASAEKLPSPQLLLNDADGVAAIEAKVRRIAHLGVIRTGSHVRPEPVAKHIRRFRAGRRVQTASVAPVDHFRPVALP